MNFMKQHKSPVILMVFCLAATPMFAQKPTAHIAFTVSMEQAPAHYYHVSMQCNAIKKDSLDFKISAWTPGYYQILDYEKAVENFHATDAAGKAISWEKPSANTWRVQSKKANSIVLTYDVKAIVPFVGSVYLDETRGYITPGGVFLYLDSELRKPVTIQIKPYSKWNKLVATGLDSLPGKQNVFYARDFDVLFDSPFLMGELEVLPSFTVKGIPHNFIGYHPGNFDRNRFMGDLKKIVESGIKIIGDIPYTHYTFLSIGEGGGGIEHLNSSSLSFYGGIKLEPPQERRRLYNFIAHEYFHHYNVKRIRPIELGPFDYSKENVTNMLWVSEGFSVYYEYMVVRRAGLSSDEDVLKSFQANIAAYENKPGHLYQSATQASHETWSDGPNGRTTDEFNKTISYYDKGPVLGLMLDFKIRHETKNRQSLDDVMRTLYKKYYQAKKRGFTDQEFQDECEKIAGASLAELFEYASTVKEIDYPKYFAYGGLAIDTATKELPGAYSGIIAREKDNTLVIREVEWNSPAWKTGLRAKDTVLEMDGNKANLQQMKNIFQTKKQGDTITMLIAKGGDKKSVSVELGKKREKSFLLTLLPNPDALQSEIYKSWMKE
jgi:predicted metalloprotease with PDZ domain